jgi:hypothetical protein
MQLISYSHPRLDLKAKEMTEGEGFARRRQRGKAEKHITEYIKNCKQGKVVILPDKQ